VTVSYITAEIDPEYMGLPKLVELARKILELDVVEVGVHGFTHPLDWQEQVVSFPIKGYSKKDYSLLSKEKTFTSDGSYKEGAVATVDQEEYHRREIEQAIQFTNEHLAPENKAVQIYQWTGNCEPAAPAIAMTDRLGVGNINRGDTRFDRSLASYTGVAPLIRQIEGQIQVQTSNANENIYTDGWEAPYDRFAQVIETFQQTEYPTLIQAKPRRVTPMNVYFHFYSGERKASLLAVKEVYDYVQSQKVTPIFTSHYVDVVKGFLSGEMITLPDGGWKLRHFGRDRTVRVDRPDVYPDLNRSKGILGFKQWEEYLYVHLDQGPEATLYLTSQPPQVPYLEESSTVPLNWSISRDRVGFDTRIFGEGVYRFANMKPKASYEVRGTIQENGGQVFTKAVMTDLKGTLEVRLEAKGHLRVEIVRGG